MHQTVKLIIGLPASGKTSLRFKFEDDKEIADFIPYEDWMRYDVWLDRKPPQFEFNTDDRYDNLINQLKLGKNVLITSIRFCNHNFLCKAEYYLQSQFPNIKIERYYFENNLKDSIAHILHKEDIHGSYWSKNENGELYFFGTHHPDSGVRTYEISINNAIELSKNYIIPLKYKCNIRQMIEINNKYYQDLPHWEILFKENPTK